jgi:hypothetical protein
MLSSRFCAIALASLGLGACLDTSSKTDLFPDLQPMLLQTRLTNTSIDSASGLQVRKRVFAFGSNPQATTIDTPDPTSIRAAAAKQTEMRLIVSDLLVGNYLEEIQCRANVDDDNFDFVPVGATPDDIAACSVSQDTLAATCTGAHAVCICHNMAGCVGADGSTIAFNAPVGVQDVNQDGAADDTRFRKGALTLLCNGAKMHDVGLDLDNSYWNPSGNQLVPAKGGFDALGPAIVVQTSDVGPAGHPTAGALPSGSSCTFVLAPEVVDKKGQRPCAPGGGANDPSLIPTLSCTPGDFSAAAFKTEALSFVVSSVLNTMLMNGGQIARTDTLLVGSPDNIPLDPGSIGGITILEGAAPYTQFTASLNADQTLISIDSTNPTGFDPNATYTLNVPATITDTFGEPNAQPIMFGFTTGAM